MKNADSTTKPSQNNQGYGWKFWLWLATALSTVLIIGVIVSAWAVLHITVGGGVRFSEKQSRTIMAIAEFPGLVRDAANEIRAEFGGAPLPLLMDRNTTEQSNWERHFPEPADTGYLLFSGLDPVTKHSIVKLIRISDGDVIAHWNPDWLVVNSQMTDKKFGRHGSSLNLTAVHPLLLSNGDIIFNTGASLVRQSPCSSKPTWVLDEIMHHSNELDETGNAFWTPSVSTDGFSGNPWLGNKVRDDALAHVSTDGVLLEKLSFARILQDNGLTALVVGISGMRLNEDPFHLNQIQIAHKDTNYWHKGDLLISARHLSTIFLYRPLTNKIIWYKTGPWMNQHSVDFVDDHRISVFNNNVISGPLSMKQMFLKPDDINQVLVYDFDNQQITQPFSTLLAETKPLTQFAGRARLIPDGGLFIEETGSGRHLRFTKDKLLWSRVNDYDKEHIGAVIWSRYLTDEEARIPLQSLATRRCHAPTGSLISNK